MGEEAKFLGIAAGLMAEDDLRGAEGAAEAAVALDPKSVQCWAMLGAIHAKQDHHEQAIACYERVISLDPLDVASQTALGELLMELGAYKQAALHLERACQLDPEAKSPSGVRARAIVAKALAKLK